MVDRPSVEPLPLPLDDASRELLAVLDESEMARVIVSTTWTDELSRSANRAGMRATVVDAGGSIEIIGPVRDVLALLRDVPVTAVSIQESTDAMRPIPDRRPVVDAPTPGRPYLDGGLGSDLAKVSISSPQREALLTALAQGIVTVDARPYERLSLEGGCGSDKAGPNCGLTVVGFAFESVGREDDWSVQSTAAGGWMPSVQVPFTTSVPRPLLRAVEWVARHDEAAVARIRAYTTCCESAWDPAKPGWITLTYSRLCANAGTAGRSLADTGECRDELRVTVDLAAGTVVRLDPAAGT